MTFIINTINEQWLCTIFNIVYSSIVSVLHYNPNSNCTLYVIVYLLHILFYMTAMFIFDFCYQTEEQKQQKAFLYIRRDDKHENR